MVRFGWALEYRQFSRGAYMVAERDAQAAQPGLWAGRLEPPDHWRAAKRAQRSQPPAPPGRCAIKGNINAKGRRIFHVPGQRDYAAMVIDTARGERWFCSTSEATAAGWRPTAR
ncbi:MAG: hypothetical protein V4514_17735 [Pseudomonadota bacterium]